MCHQVGKTDSVQQARRHATSEGLAALKAEMHAELKAVQQRLETLVHKAEFFPVKVIAYGLAAGSMGAVVTAVISRVILK